MPPSPAPALRTLRFQLRQEAPPRDGLDYWIMGDAAHQRRRSQHNTGDAIDVPTKLLGLYRCNQFIETVRYDAANGYEPRVAILIWARRIAHFGTRWQWQPYHGVDPHEWHAHIGLEERNRANPMAWRLS